MVMTSQLTRSCALISWAVQEQHVFAAISRLLGNSFWHDMMSNGGDVSINLIGADEQVIQRIAEVLVYPL